MVSTASAATTHTTKNIAKGLTASLLSTLTKCQLKQSPTLSSSSFTSPRLSMVSQEGGAQLLISSRMSLRQLLQAKPCCYNISSYVLTFLSNSQTYCLCRCLDSWAACLFLILCSDFGSFFWIIFVLLSSGRVASSSDTKWDLKLSSVWCLCAHSCFFSNAMRLQNCFFVSPGHLRHIKMILTKHQSLSIPSNSASQKCNSLVRFRDELWVIFLEEGYGVLLVGGVVYVAMCLFLLFLLAESIFYFIDTPETPEDSC